MAYGDYGRSTELEAVNICLAVIGEAPVNSIGSGVTKSTIARDTIYECSRDIQLEGLLCNTIPEYTLMPDGSNNFVLPNNTLDVDPIYASDNKFVERNGMLYDTEDNTAVITSKPNGIKVKLIQFLTWTDLPQHVRRYALIRAARQFQKRFLGDGEIHQFTEEDEIRAKRQHERKEVNNKDYSILDNTSLSPRYYKRQW